MVKKRKRKLSRCPECGNIHFLIEVEKRGSPAIRIECTMCGDSYSIDVSEEEMIFVMRGMGHGFGGVV